MNCDHNNKHAQDKLTLAELVAGPARINDRGTIIMCKRVGGAWHAFVHFASPLPSLIPCVVSEEFALDPEAFPPSLTAMQVTEAVALVCYKAGVRAEDADAADDFKLATASLAVVPNRRSFVPGATVWWSLMTTQLGKDARTVNADTLFNGTIDAACVVQFLGRSEPPTPAHVGCEFKIRVHDAPPAEWAPAIEGREVTNAEAVRLLTPKAEALVEFKRPT